MNKDVRQLMKAAKREGLEVATQGDHLRVTNPATGEWTTVAKTPSDYRWRKNCLVHLRRIGFRGCR
ncbi:hypothetical protein NYO98_10385 [Nocardioides sp. STR2]|uniref:HicA toxin of toxin-antitoxin n=1 Tax=Nocardioides pini TaxID=2975053 RepID=A0ABT4CCJ9_9ACTN|nr:hypothetical protein [Nocardioides pini]MCY4726685.1 hypothetical protein [Nocardioides pini]